MEKSVATNANNASLFFVVARGNFKKTLIQCLQKLVFCLTIVFFSLAK